METIKIEELKESEYNPREIDKQNFKNLCDSIRKHGILSPIVINTFPGREKVIIAGHQRVKAAKEVGLIEVPIIKVNLDPASEKALNLALNKISGRFTEDKLIDLIEQINNENQDILTQTGFNTEEINYLLGLSEKQREGIFARGAEDGFNAANKYGIQEGDIIKLDDHKIICGNRLFPQTYRQLLGEEKVDLIVTSPPYNLDIKYGKYNDNKEYKNYFESIRTVFSNCKDFLSKGRYLCINIGREWGPINMPAKYDYILEEIGYTFFRNIYWKKPGFWRGERTNLRNPFPRHYKPMVQTEMIEIYSNEEEPEIFNHMISYKYGDDIHKKKGEPIPQILLNKYWGNVWDMMTETKLGENHPAVFPVQLPFNCIRFFTFEKEKILDPYLGSGTSIIAADQLNRIGYGIEIDPEYVSLAIERFLMYKPNAKLEIIKNEK